VARPDSYSKVVEQLRERISGAHYRECERLPSENALAREFCLSRPSIRKALGVLEEQRLIHRKPGIGTFVGPDTSRVRTENYTIAIDLPAHRASQFYYAYLLEGLQSAGTGNRFAFDFLPEAQLDNFDPSSCDAVVTFCASTARVRELEAIARQGIPVVMVNRFPESRLVGHVSLDYRAEIAKGVGYLLDIGHRRIAYGGSISPSRAQENSRWLGYCDAFRLRGLEPDVEMCFGNDNYSWNDFGSFYRAQKPSAVFMTLGYFMPLVMGQIMGMGLAIPDDLSLMCFDRIERTIHDHGVDVSQLWMPLEYIGRRCGEYVLQKIEFPAVEPIAELVEAKLVVTGSCRRLTPEERE
jgi:DNA-binding LacI/PurR family transcriptional regulator/ribosomal protein S14